MPDFDVVELPEISHVEVGDRAPDFTRPLVNQEFWEDTSLSTLTDRGPVVLVFYPMNGTGVAKLTWIKIRRREWGNGLNLTVVGLSISTPYEHRSFIKKHQLPYGLFSDPSGSVIQRYGVTHDHDGMTGVVGARPALFVVDEDREVQYAWIARKWPDFPDFDNIEHNISALARS